MFSLFFLSIVSIHRSAGTYPLVIIRAFLGNSTQDAACKSIALPRAQFGTALGLILLRGTVPGGGFVVLEEVCCQRDGDAIINRVCCRLN